MLRPAVLAVFLMFVTTEAHPQTWSLLTPDFVGIRIHGPLRGGIPAIVKGQQIRFTLDGLHAQPRDLRVEVLHCDMNWEPTLSEFINDPFLMRGRKPVPSSDAAAGIRSYRWTYATSIPSGAGLEPFRYSGNYIASIVDIETETIVATFRFAVAERAENAVLSVRRRRLGMKISPWDEAHAVTMRVDENSLGSEQDDVYLQLVRVVDVYRNREWETPVRIDLNRLTPATWVEGLGTSRLSFTAGAIMPGNEYRVLDIRNVEKYPASSVLRSQDGADVSRFFAASSNDHNGASVISGSRSYADYERFEFQLWWDADDRALPVYVVGDFNGWTKSPAWRLVEYGEEGRFSLTALLKRGRYDYQYVVGDDPIVLEGNSWKTRNLYTGLVYYTDARLGGYDRILFVSQVESDGHTGTQEEESR